MIMMIKIHPLLEYLGEVFQVSNMLIIAKKRIVGKS